MLNQRKDAALNLSSRLFETEKAIDEAIAKMADLAGYMPIARQSANLSAVVGHEALNSAGQTLVALIAARGEIVETHNHLAKARDEIGLRTFALGGGGSKAMADEKPELSVVEKAA